MIAATAGVRRVDLMGKNTVRGYRSDGAGGLTRCDNAAGMGEIILGFSSGMDAHTRASKLLET